jgi:hypothetical protein
MSIRSVDQVLVNAQNKEITGQITSTKATALTNIGKLNKYKATKIQTQAKSKGKLCAFLSCITSIPRSARLMISAQLFIRWPEESMID